MKRFIIKKAKQKPTNIINYFIDNKKIIKKILLIIGLTYILIKPSIVTKFVSHLIEPILIEYINLDKKYNDYKDATFKN